MWRPGGNRAGRREYSLVTNCLRTVDKKVNNPENQSWVNVQFQKFACHEVWLYGIEGRRWPGQVMLNAPQFQFFLLYPSGVLSVIDYGLGLTTMAQTYLLNLDRVQNEAMRVIFENTNEPTH